MKFSQWLDKYELFGNQKEWAKVLDDTGLMLDQDGIGSGKSWLLDRYEEYVYETTKNEDNL